jgi:hypothetical protein
LLGIATKIFRKEFTNQINYEATNSDYTIKFKYEPSSKQEIYLFREHYMCDVDIILKKKENINENIKINYCSHNHKPFQNTKITCMCNVNKKFTNIRNNYVVPNDIINKCSLTNLYLKNNTFVNKNGLIIHDELLKFGDKNSGIIDSISYLANALNAQNIQNFINPILLFFPRIDGQFEYDFSETEKDKQKILDDYKKYTNLL